MRIFVTNCIKRKKMVRRKTLEKKSTVNEEQAKTDKDKKKKCFCQSDVLQNMYYDVGQKQVEIRQLLLLVNWWGRHLSEDISVNIKEITKNITQLTVCKRYMLMRSSRISKLLQSNFMTWDISDLTLNKIMCHLFFQDAFMFFYFHAVGTIFHQFIHW